MSPPAEIPVVALVGPTGVGKTAVAVALAREYLGGGPGPPPTSLRAEPGPSPFGEGIGPASPPETVALAREWRLEAVSVDSRQVYRRMDIGTAKPSGEERRRLPHHLLDVAEPDEPYDAARFAREAAAAIAGIHARGRRALLVGGTGLYLEALLHGLSPMPPADLALRRRLRAETAAEGASALHRRLADVDPVAAARLHPRDVMRVVRALEIALQAGEPASVVWARRRPPRAPYRTLLVGLTMPREALHARLDARVDRMIAAGLLREVEGLLAGGFGPELSAMQGIGYRHLAPVLTRGASLEAAIATMKRDTRRYAKRQWTWFARMEVARWITVDGDDAAVTAAEVKKTIESAGTFD